MKICRQYFPENAFKAASAACRLLAMALCMLAAASLSLSARTSAGTDSLAVATVLADRTQRTAPSDSISGERLESAQNVADAIRVFGGIQLKDYGGVGGLKTVNVRSMGSEHTGVFIDGIQIGNAQNAQVDLGRFSTEDLASISLCSGLNEGVLLSAKEYSSGASVYLHTARPDFSDGRSFHGKVRIRGGSFGTVSPYIRWEQRLGRKISASASIEYLGADGRYMFRCRKEAVTADGMQTGYDTTMVRSNSDIHALRAQADIYGPITGGEWSVKAYFYGSGRGLPGAVVRHPEQLSTASDRQEDRNIFIQGRMRRNAGRKCTFMLRWRYANDWMRFHNDPSRDPSAMPVDDSYLQQEAYISISGYVRLFPWWKVSIAADAQFNSLDSDKRDSVYPRRGAFWGAAFTGFALKRLTVTAGAVYNLTADYWNMSGQETGVAPDSRCRDFRNVVSPAMTFRYTPFGSRLLGIGGFVRRSYRMPTFNDLYYVDFGNVSLRPEDAMQYDLRLDCTLNPAAGWTLSAKAEGYYYNIKDKIVSVPTSSQFRWTMYNIGHSHITGAEGLISWEYRTDDGTADAAWRDISGHRTRKGGLTAGMTARYTFQRAMDVSRPGTSTYGGQIPYIPRHSGSVTASVAWKGWRADYSFIYTGIRYSSSANLVSTLMQPWTTHDITLSRKFGTGLTFRLTVNNILNRQYEIVPGYPMPRCNFLVSAEYTF